MKNRHFYDLEAALRKLWETDEPIRRKHDLTPDEIWCEQHFRDTHNRDKDGIYITRISIKPQDLRLGDLLRTAELRFFSLERRLQQDSDLRDKYTNFMRECKDMDHMKITPSQPLPNQPYYYIPHHPKKFRVVFDASAKTTNGKSLNDFQLPGPKIQPDLYDTILRFRRNKLAISADIAKMFK